MLISYIQLPLKESATNAKNPPIMGKLAVGAILLSISPYSIAGFIYADEWPTVFTDVVISLQFLKSIVVAGHGLSGKQPYSDKVSPAVDSALYTLKLVPMIGIFPIPDKNFPTLNSFAPLRQRMFLQHRTDFTRETGA
ncbi:MAG: hypothetical protein Q9183_001254 [Haloplaca sp. 2 TL-2023]